MILATWNVNSVRVREERLVRWLSTRQPDVACLQELKCVSEEFPFAAVEAAGYHCEVHGQRSYNGVAILSRAKPSEVVRGLGRSDLDDEARFLAATIEGVRVICAYVPAGGENRQSPKYASKIQWLRALLDHLREGLGSSPQLALCGDFNIAPEEKDVASPQKWRDSAVFNDELSEMFREILSLGFSDCFRMHTADEGRYTWWDYDDLGYQRNEGLRIDHILMPSVLCDRCYRCWIDWEEREGTKPSDHAPVLADFDWARARGGLPGERPGKKAGKGDRFATRVEPVHGEEAARGFVRSAFPQTAASLSEQAKVRVRWTGGFEEELLWNYFPAGVQEWTFDGADRWFEVSAK